MQKKTFAHKQATRAQKTADGGSLAKAAAKHPIKLDWATSLFSTKSAGDKEAMRKKLAELGLK